MRLINVSKMLPDVCLATALDKGVSFYSYFYSENRIENAPTVEAIPIEWVEDVISLARKVGAFDYAEDLENLIKDWREENG